MHISKSDYLKYLECPLFLWYWKHDKAKVQEDIDLSGQAVIDQGIDFENRVRKLFPDGVLAKGSPIDAEANTKKLISNGNKIIFQATAITDKFLAMADVFQFDEDTQSWNIFEIKGSTQINDNHIDDTCFQKLLFEDAGYTIGKVFLIHVNSKYIRKGSINIKELSHIEDITDKVLEIEEETKTRRQDACDVIENKTPPKLEDFKVSVNLKDSWIRELCCPDMPEYSIFDICRIYKKKANDLYEAGITDIQEVPDDFDLSENQKNQVYAAKTGETFIDKKKIKKVLDSLKYPLYFLDYETIYPLVPPFENGKPYQQLPFQYSLHVFEKPNGKPQHFEFLAKDLKNPIEELAISLRENLKKDDGSIIVWNKSFEMSRNKEIGIMFPEFASFMGNINERVFDLMEMFKNQLYIHPDFRGSCSIKKVLPVLVPELSYKDLQIQEGGTASASWYQMAIGNDQNSKKTYQNLLKYCELDTLAMVKIWEVLVKL